MKNSKDNLDQAKQSIEDKKYKHQNGTLATTFQKPTGGTNPYVRFGYTSRKVCNHIWGKVSGSMNSDTNNANKQVNKK